MSVWFECLFVLLTHRCQYNGMVIGSNTFSLAFGIFVILLFVSFASLFKVPFIMIDYSDRILKSFYLTE